MNNYILLNSGGYIIHLPDVLMYDGNYHQPITRYSNDILKLHIGVSDYIKIKDRKVVYSCGGSIRYIYNVDIVIEDPPIEDIPPVESILSYDVYTYILQFLKPVGNEHLILATCITDPIVLLINHIENNEQAPFDPIMAISYMHKDDARIWDNYVKKAFIQFLYSSPDIVEYMMQMVRVDEKLSHLPLEDRIRNSP